MIPYSFYKLVHLLGIFMLFLSVGGLIHHILNGGTKAANAWRKQTAITHGIGIFLILLGGFGMLARLGLSWPFPGWVMAKIAIWIAMGGMLALVYRRPQSGRFFWLLVLVLGLGAAYLAILKPF